MKTTFIVAHVIIVIGFLALILFLIATSPALDLNFYSMLVVFAVYTFLFGFAVGKNLILSSQKIIVAKGDFEKTRLEIMKREKVMEKKMESIMGNFKETISALEQKVKNRTFELERVLTDLERHQELAKQKEVKIALLETQLQKLKKKGKTTKKK